MNTKYHENTALRSELDAARVRMGIQAQIIRGDSKIIERLMREKTLLEDDLATSYINAKGAKETIESISGQISTLAKGVATQREVIALLVHGEMSHEMLAGLKQRIKPTHVRSAKTLTWPSTVKFQG